MLANFLEKMVWGVPLWLFLIGITGQGMFFGRFLVQWISSEVAKRSVFPMAFWYLSVAGSITLFVYGVFRKDLVILIGQTTGSIIYFRNIYFRKREARES